MCPATTGSFRGAGSVLKSVFTWGEQFITIEFMKPNELYESRQADWQKLTELLEQCQRNVGGLSPAGVQELSRLYRATTADLALAQRDFPDNRVTQYLNQLVARAHAQIYRGEPFALKRVRRFVTHSFPRTFRRTFPFTLVSFLLFMIPALVIGWVVATNPAGATTLLPAGTVDGLLPYLEEQELWTEVPLNQRPGFSAMIMTNNIRVAFLAFAGGVLAGIGTLFTMLQNGWVIGGVFGLAAFYDLGFELGTFAIGHGVIELTVIFMAGGAGLQMGWAILRPGFLRRRDALAKAARRAVRLIIGAVPLLIIAGMIEGFISPNELLPWPVKWGFGVFTGVVLFSYLGLSGRESKRN